MWGNNPPKDAWGRSAEDLTLKLDLMETGTRWAHYSELRELFAYGVEIIKNMHVKSSGDQEKQKKLEGAIELLDARINLLSDFSFNTTYGSKLRAVIETEIDPMYRRMRVENQINDAKSSKKPEDHDDPTTYSTK